MEIKFFLQQISPYTLVNFSLLKRIFSDTELKALRGHLAQAVADGLLILHPYPQLRCYSLSALGFQLIGITHQPKLQFTAEQADNICRSNHIRKGFEQSLDHYKGLTLTKWISGSKFHKLPLCVRIKNKEQALRPAGAAIISDQAGGQKLFFVHHFTDTETLNRDIFLYQQATERQLCHKRFFLNDDTTIRVIVLIASYKTLHQFKRYLQNPFYQNVLFLPLTHSHHTNLLQQAVFMNLHGKKQAIAKSP